jgi:hypothetical protein
MLTVIMKHLMMQFLLLAAIPCELQAETIEVLGRECYPLATKMAESGLPFKIDKNGNACDESFEAVREQV